MSILDDPARLASADPADMLGAVAAFPDDAEASFAAARAVEQLPAADDLRSLVFLGMGGSAVTGDIVRALYADRLGISIETVRSPRLPSHVSQHSLVVALSFSGYTAETLAAFEEAVDRGARMIAVTSGGTLATRASQEGIPVVPITPGGQPRAALGRLAFGTLGVLEAMGVTPSVQGDVTEAIRVLRTMAQELAPSSSGGQGKELAVWIGERAPVIWGAEGIGATAAARWKTQFNENGKTPAWASSMSELDHNEIVGWTGNRGDGYALITLRSDEEDPSIIARFALSIEAVAASGLEHREVQARGASPLARLFSLIYTGDFASVYSGLLRGADPTPVEVIDRLKQALG